MPLPRRWEDLPQDYRTALEAGAGTAPVRIVVRLDPESRLQVHDVWDMRPARLRPGGRPALLEEGIVDWEDASRVSDDAQTNRRTIILSEVPRVR